MRHAAIEQRRSAGEVRDVFDMCRSHDARVVLRDVHEQLVELDVLLRVGADEVVKWHPGDREHRLSVELRVVEAVQKMNTAGPGCREADAETSRELRVAARHEGRGLFMTQLHEADRISFLTQLLL